MRRFYDEQPFRAGDIAVLSPEPAHHLARVLRARAGDELVVFNGKGGEWRARVESVEKKRVRIKPVEFIDEDRTPALEVMLALPLIKGERMDYVLQKGTELGAAAFRLLEMERSDVRLGGERLERKMDHWRKVITSACEQCGMNRVPVLYSPVPVNTCVAETEAQVKLMASAQGRPLREVFAEPEDRTGIIVLTGPEGGFSDAETHHAAQHGFEPACLGERILRAETAPAAMLAGLWSLAG